MKLHSPPLYCIGADSGNLEHGFLKSGQIKSKLTIWIDTNRGKGENIIFLCNLGEPNLELEL